MMPRKFWKNKKAVIPLPFRYYYVPVLIIALAGIADSVYLAVSHYRVYTDIGYKSFCAVSRTLNCDTVSQSAYAILMGLPVAVWGVIGYTFFVLLLVLAGLKATQEKPGWSLLLGISIIFSGYSIVLALISNYLIHSYCIMCIVSYVINLLLLFYCWLIRRRFGHDGFLKGLIKDTLFFMSTWKNRLAMIVFAALVLLLFFSFPAYWEVRAVQLDHNLPQGQTQDGHPWIGAENPDLTIVEYTDYLCFQCRKMHFHLRRLMTANPGKIRLVHRHFPMDSQFNPLVKDPFHEGAGKMALLAIYAGTQGQFWKMNDVLFTMKKESFDTKTLAQKTGLKPEGLGRALYSPKIKMALMKDIQDGLKAGVNGTPAYIVNGKIHFSVIPPKILKKITDSN